MVTDKEEKNEELVDELGDFPSFDLPEFSLEEDKDKDKDNEEHIIDSAQEEVQEEKIVDQEIPPSRETPSEEKKDNSSSRMSVSLALAKALHEGGYISDYDEKSIKDGGLENIFDLLDAEMNKRVDAYIDTLDNDLKDIVQAKEAGVNLEEFKKLKSNVIELKTITNEKLEADVELRKKILKTYYKETSKMSDQSIDKIIQRTIDLDEDLDESKNALSELITIRDQKAASQKQEAINLAEKRKNDAKNKLTEIQTSIKEFSEIIPGIKLSDKDRANLYKTVTDVVSTIKDRAGNDIPLNAVMANRAKNPVKWDGIVAYFHQIGLLNFDDKGKWTPNFSKLISGGKSKAVKELEGALEKNNFIFDTGKGAADFSNSEIEPTLEGVNFNFLSTNDE